MTSVSLAGRLVVVTGATSGIGRASALAFRDAGARVVGTGRDQCALAALAADVDLALSLDVTDRSSVSIAAASVLDGPGVPDVIVNNAGIGQFSSWDQTSASDLERLLAVNLVGAARVARALLPSMVERGSGVLVNVASVAGLRGYPLQTGYCATKHGLVGWSRALTEELRGTGVRVVTVCPPAVDTPFRERAGIAALGATPPWARLMSAETVARSIVEAALSGEGEVVVGGRARLLHALARLAPGAPARLRALERRVKR